MKDRIKWGVLLAVCLLLVIGNVRTYAQQDMGRIISVPVVNAWTLKEISDSLKVEILSPKDSSLVFTFESGTMTEKFPTQWYGPFLMRVTHPHYYPVLKRITVYKKKMSVILDKVELTPITKLTEQRLGEATVSATRVQMVMKGDTVVYDARAFQTAEGSMLEELIEQLPGVRLDDNGRITLNGKFVSSLLLNGKDFFRGDPTVALRNLPAYMVDKVKGYERTPKGLSSRSEVRETVLDVQLKREYSRGYIANTDWAAGTRDRYAGRLFGLCFTDRSRVSLYGKLNNVNDTRRPGRNGSWEPTDLVGGLTAQKEAGVDYMYDSGQSFELSANARYSHYDTDYRESTNGETYLPAATAYDRAQRSSRNRSTSWNANMDLTYHPTSELYLFVAPLVNYRTYDETAFARSAQFDANPELYGSADGIFNLWDADAVWRRHALTVTERQTLNDGSFLDIRVPVNFSQAFKSNNDGFDIEGSFSYSRSRDKRFAHSFYDYVRESSQDERSEYAWHPKVSQVHDWTLRYTYKPYQDGQNYFAIIPSYRLNYCYLNNDYDFYRLDSLPGWDAPIGYLPSTRDSLSAVLDARNSPYQSHRDWTHTPSVRLFGRILTEGKVYSQLNVGLTIPVEIHSDRMSYVRNDLDTMLVRRVGLFQAQATIEYKKGYANKIELNYQLRTQAPDQADLLDWRDDADPLNVRLGNPWLRNTRYHTTQLYMKKYNSRKRRNTYASLKWNVVESALSQSVRYDASTGRRTYRPENVSGNWSLDGEFTLTQPLGPKRRFRLTNETALRYNHNVDLTGEGLSVERSVVRWFTTGETLRGEYRQKSWRVSGRLGVDWLTANSARESFETVSTTNWTAGVAGQVTLPLDIELATDVTLYARRGYSDASMNTTDWVWNARLSRSFLRGKPLTVSLEGFDLLHSLDNVTRTLNAQGRTETRRNVLPNYVMLHLSYRFNLNPKKGGDD